MYHLWFSGSWRCQRQSCKEAKRLRIHPIYLSRSCHACPRKYGSQGSTFSFSFGFPPHMHLLSSKAYLIFCISIWMAGWSAWNSQNLGKMILVDTLEPADHPARRKTRRESDWVCSKDTSICSGFLHPHQREKLGV